jgi:catechol 2,3-dioxygenase-like lactoylglutathione lyase family enzyme
MSVVGLHHVAIRVPTLDRAIENYAQLGLPVVAHVQHPVSRSHAVVLAVGDHRVVLVEAGDPAGASSVLTPGPFAYISLRVTHNHHARDSLRHEGLFGPSEWLSLPTANSAFELVDLDPPERVVGDTGLWRIESIPWSVSDRAAATAEATESLGLSRSDRYSDLVFPDLLSTNTLLFIGDDCYIDFNEPTDKDSPTARRLSASGNGAFALVLEPQNFDDALAALRQRGVPTVTPDAVDLRVTWPDGTTGSAARIISIDKAFTGGARIFVSEPTFPW